MTQPSETPAEPSSWRAIDWIGYARDLAERLSAAQSALAEKEREVGEWKKRQRADEDQLVWLAEWCRRFTGVDNNLVIGRDGWPNRLVEVVAKAAEVRAAEAEKVISAARKLLAECNYVRGMSDN